MLALGELVVFHEEDDAVADFESKTAMALAERSILLIFPLQGDRVLSDVWAN